MIADPSISLGAADNSPSISRADDGQKEGSVLDSLECVKLAGGQIEELPAFEHLTLLERGDGHRAFEAMHDDFACTFALGNLLVRAHDQANDFHVGRANKRSHVSRRHRASQGTHVDDVAGARGRLYLWLGRGAVPGF